MPKQTNNVAVKVVVEVEGSKWSEVRPAAEALVKDKMGDTALKVEAINVELVRKRITKPL